MRLSAAADTRARNRPRNAPGTEAIELAASHLSHIGEELPARWLDVRADIEARSRDAAHISRQEYYVIYARHLEWDRTKALHLSRYLHELGAFLHFQNDPLLERTIILQNTWATDAVYRVLDDEIIKHRKGRFGRSDCERLWHDRAYVEMHAELLALMQRFELCYELPDTAPSTWLAPQLLASEKPDALRSWQQGDDLVVR